MAAASPKQGNYVQQFQRDGYCVIEDFLSADQVAQLQAATQYYHQSLRNNTIRDVHIHWEAAGRIQQILNAELVSPLLNEVIRSEEFVKSVRPLVGPDIGLYHCKILMKAPGGDAIPWHQDYSYWSHASSIPCQVNCMVYLDDADEENGCLEVVPGSQRGGLEPHEESEGVFSRALAIDPAQVVKVPGRAGTAILFGPLLYHASGKNASTRSRRSFTVVYSDPTRDKVRETYHVMFPRERVKQISGPGIFPCPEAYHRRALWKLGANMVADRSLPWVEISDSTFEENSFEWLAARKPAQTQLHRFERYPLTAANRDDVRISVGPVEETIAQLTSAWGFAHVDCNHYFSARAALDRLMQHRRVGSVVVFEKFYNCHESESPSLRALRDVVREHAAGFEYLGRASQQVALRFTDGAYGDCPVFAWDPGAQGIHYG